MAESDMMAIFSGSSKIDFNVWEIVNDGVMGGLSQGELIINEVGNAVFTGFVTSENNGGFSLARLKFGRLDVTNYSQVVVHLEGDRRGYKFRLKTESVDKHSYIKSFETSGAWETVVLDLTSFYPSFRGKHMNKPNYPGRYLEEIALFAGTKQREIFRLEISEIHLR